METSFTVTEVNLAAGFCIVSAVGPDGVAHSLTIDTATIAVSSHDTEAMLTHTLSQVVKQEIGRLYPAPAPQPAFLEQMVGKTYVG